MRPLRVHRNAVQRIEAGHVWVYREEILDGSLSDEVETVKLCDDRGRPFCTALLDAASQVPVRVYSKKQEEFGESSIRARILEAIEWRARVVSKDSTAYRVVFSESDSLPGLIIDRYGSGAAIQCTMRNYLPWLDSVVEALETNFVIEAAVLETGGTRSIFRENVSYASNCKLNSIVMVVDLMDGPKTGAFLDQRENYLAVRDIAVRLGLGGKALDLFSSNGGFALHLAKVMDRVDAVDVSESAIAMVNRNAALNGLTNIRAIKSDVKQYLRGLIQAKHRYSLIVCDPPAFAKSKRHKEEALRAYYDLNLRAIGALERKAVYVSCSCSANVSETDLLDVVRQSAAVAKRSLTLLDKRSQALDHRSLLSVPESSYLKCLVFSAHN